VILSLQFNSYSGFDPCFATVVDVGETVIPDHGFRVATDDPLFWSHGWPSQDYSPDPLGLAAAARPTSVASVGFLKKRWSLPSTTFIHLDKPISTSNAKFNLLNSTATQKELLTPGANPVKRKSGTSTAVATSMPSHVPYWAPRQTVGPVPFGQDMEDKDVLERRRKAHNDYNLAERYASWRGT
jgi:hypothetical protein